MSTETIVLKLGGAVLTENTQLDAIANDVARLVEAGTSVVIVHGGGPQATTLSRKLGIEPTIVGGRRVTDEAALDIAKMIYAGRLSVDLTCALTRAGLKAVGLSGVSSGLIDAVKRPPRVVSGGGPNPIDFGHVGDIAGINTDLLQRLFDGQYVPVMNSLGADQDGNAYNINADIAATRVAEGLQADHLLLIAGGVPGVLRDKDDPTTRIPRLTVKEAREAIAEGVIQGGMIPKIEESLNVLHSGVGAIHILGSVSAGDLLRELEDAGAVGTALVP